MKPFKVTNSYIFIVNEFPNKKNKSGRIHGAYINREEACGKYCKLITRGTQADNLAILKMSLKGKSRVRNSLDLHDCVYIQVKED